LIKIILSRETAMLAKIVKLNLFAELTVSTIETSVSAPAKEIVRSTQKEDALLTDTVNRTVLEFWTMFAEETEEIMIIAAS